MIQNKKYISKRTIKKSLTGILIASVASFLSCAPSPKQKVNYDDLIKGMEIYSQEYKSFANQTRNFLELSLMDNIFSASEQQQVCSILDLTKESYSNYLNILSQCPEESEPIICLQEDFPWHALLTQNVYGFDGDHPELQSVLSKHYPEIEVEPIYSNSEQASDLLAEVSSGIIEVLLSD